MIKNAIKDTHADSGLFIIQHMHIINSPSPNKGNPKCNDPFFLYQLNTELLWLLRWHPSAHTKREQNIISWHEENQ